MATLHVGARCGVCPLVDFLPITCPHCSLVYCKDHISTHACAEAKTSTYHHPKAPSSSFAKKTQCDVDKCERPRIEAIGGYSDGEIAKQVRCEYCGGAFCTHPRGATVVAARCARAHCRHRRQDEHACPAQRDYTARSDAGEARKQQARDIMAKHFPDRAQKGYDKPVAHTRDLKRTRPPSPERLPPSLQPGLPAVPANAEVATATPRPKTKAEKLHGIQLKKLRMAAKPLIVGQKPDLPRRWFELKEGLTGMDVVSAWRDSGKLGGVTQKVWVHEVTPIGKVFDVMLQKGRITRPQGDDPAEVLSLVTLVAEPDTERGSVPLSLSDAASAVPEGSVVMLVKGWKG